MEWCEYYYEKLGDVNRFENLWAWVPFNWWCVTIWCQWIISSQDRKFCHVTWVTHTHNDQLNASHTGENAKMTHTGILAKRIIQIRLMKSYEEHDFWTSQKKGLRSLLPRYLGIRIIGNEKKKTPTEKGIRTILFMYHQKSKNTIQKSGLYNFNRCTYWLPTHPYLIKYCCSSMTYRAVNLLVAPGGCSRRCINQLCMVRWVRQLNGANVHHGLGGEFSNLRRSYGVSSWSRKTKKSRFTTTTTLRRISYVGIRRISTGA
jgi:hypothetical protein